MLFLHAHGAQAQPGPQSAARRRAGRQSAASVCGFTGAAGAVDLATAPLAKFGYLFPQAPAVPDSPAMVAALDAVANAMVDQQGGPSNAPIPAFFTYIGQFIDHDITAGTDRETDFSAVDVLPLVPRARADVERNLANLRSGALDLDSVYGDALLQGPLAHKLRVALRYPPDRAKLMLGRPFDDGSGPALPVDKAGDLLRLDWALRRQPPLLKRSDLNGLPADLKELFLNPDGSVQGARALIGDSRNDENLAVAQIHMAMIRFHNLLADLAPPGGGSAASTAQARFDWAARQLRWHHQWLVVNAYLPTICEPATWAEVRRGGARLYADFLAEQTRGGVLHGKLPLPLEFSVAAFRFGHSMVRNRYDWNEAGGASMRDLFELTGNPGRTLPNAANPAGSITPSRLNQTDHRLPRSRLADMARLLNVGQTNPNRNARGIDTRLVPTLADMPTEPPGQTEVLRHLARRNLRRGHLLSLPSAQGCIAALAAKGVVIQPLSPDALRAVPGGAGLSDALAAQTPLWFYILAEAELRNGGATLGALGSRIVAETLLGLVAQDPGSYWHQPGGGPDGRWHPADGPAVNGVVADSYENLMRAVGLL